MTEPMKLKVLRRVIAFIVAAAVMVIVGSATHSYFVQSAWSTAAGRAAATGPAPVPFADRLAWAAHDLGGMFVSYAGLTSMALLIAFLTAGLLARFSGFRVFVFGLAGALAIFVMFTALRFFLGTVGIFGARGPLGLSAQMAVGLVAGVVFAQLTRPRVA
jgi:hypothetical protein